MTSRLLQNIKHGKWYDAGGVAGIYLLDVRDFVSYRFKDDKLYDRCLVEKINIAVQDYITLDTVGESNFSENYENGVYKQQLATFVRSLSHNTTSDLLLAASNRYVVIIHTSQGKTYTFGSDGGASVRFTQQTGQMGEVSGYAVTIEKNSVYPLFEIDIDNTQHVARIFDDTFNDKFN